MLNGPFFISTYLLTVDDKGRLMVPADVRKELDEETALIIVIGQNGKHWLYPENYYRQHIAPRPNDAVLDEDVLNYMMLTFSAARRVVPDKQGRMVLPDDQDFDRQAIGREVALVGMGNHLQLWPRQEWFEHRDKLRGREPETAKRYRQAQAKGPETNQ